MKDLRVSTAACELSIVIAFAVYSCLKNLLHVVCIYSCQSTLLCAVIWH
jgi:hypothetical protein